LEGEHNEASSSNAYTAPYHHGGSMEKMSLAERVRALADDASEACKSLPYAGRIAERMAWDRHDVTLRAIAADLERIAEEMRRDGEKDYGDGADRVPGCTLVAWADALADRKGEA
jgi:hypothetical protein